MTSPKLTLSLHFQNEDFSNWVIGPELGKFIAGIRNDDTQSCVHNVERAWKYASKAAVWKDDDPTLTVKCYEPEGKMSKMSNIFHRCAML